MHQDRHTDVMEFYMDRSCFVPNNEYFLQGFVIEDVLYSVVLFTSLTGFYETLRVTVTWVIYFYNCQQ